LATDSNTFIFAVLQEDRKAFVSKQLDRLDEKGLIISFLDRILQDAIESSPHTTPIRTRKSLGATYQFGDGDNSSDTAVDDNLGTWNVVEINGVSLLQLCEDDGTDSP
jgi:hypothetical protein